jgi:hypothetical protein
VNELTAAIHARLSGDATLAAMLASYKGAPAVFTTDPAPGDALLPYIVTAGQVSDAAFDTKTVSGRQLWRDVRCYASADGSAAEVEAIAERVRVLLHRQVLTIPDFVVFVAECSGPIAADEEQAYGRVVTVRMMAMQEV